MAGSNSKLELVIEVDTSKGNAAIKTFNTGLSDMEAAAARATRSASGGIDSMTASMVKGVASGNLLADSIKKMVEWVYRWTIEAARYAMQTNRMEAVTTGLAKAQGQSSTAALNAIEVVKKAGYSSQEAMAAVQQMVVAEMDLAKARPLAQLAKDAAAASTEGLSASEAFEKLIMAVESGQARGLRSLRIFVDLGEAEKAARLQAELHGRTLSDLEVKEARYNAILAASAGLRGAAADAANTASGQLAKLNRTVDDLKNAIGKGFQDDLRQSIELLNQMAGALKQNLDVLENIAAVSLLAGGGAGGWKLMGKAGALFGVSTAAVAGVVGTAGSIAVFTNEVLQFIEDSEQRGLRMQSEAKNRSIAQLAASGKSLADLKKMGLSEEDIRKALGGKGEVKPGEYETASLVSRGPNVEDLERAVEIRKREIEGTKSTHEAYMRTLEERRAAEHDVARQRIEDSMKVLAATSSEVTAAKESLNILLLSRQEYAAGIAKIREEEKREIAQRSTFEYKGQLQHRALSTAELESIHKATAEKIAAFNIKFAEEEGRRIEEMWKAMGTRQQRFIEQWVVGPIRQDLEVLDQTSQLDQRRRQESLSIERDAVEQRRNLGLAQLEGMDAQTIQAKVALEARKTQIEVEAIRARTDVELREIDLRTEHDIAAAEKAAYAKGIFDEDRISRITTRIRELGEQEKAALTRAGANEVDVAQAKSAGETRRIVTDQYRSIFNSLKQQAGGVFDALLQKSQSVWSAIGNSLKTAILTAIKEVVTSRVAAMLMQLFTGTRVSMASAGGGGGILGRLGGILGIGAVPVFGGSGPIPGGMGGGWSTPPFIPGGGYGSGGGSLGSASAGGSILSKAGLAGLLPGLKSFLGIGGSIQLGAGMATTWEAATLGQKLSAIGKSNAALMAGAMLAMDGLRRGGMVGLAETTAGGAAIGFKFGGSLGAAIGAGIGAMAGIVRLFVKSAEEKVREKIKATYGVDISDKTLLRQIVETAKQAYGGNLDMAIRSAQVQELIQLYAMSTGQAARGMPASLRSVGLVQSGGSLYQSQGYSNGTVLPSFGGLPTLDNVGNGAASNAGSGMTVVSFQVDSKEVGRAIIQDGRVVSQGMIKATKSSAGRRELTSLQMSPGLLTS